MRGALIVARRDLRALFRAPLAWLVLAGASFVLAWVFLWFVQTYLQVAPHLDPDSPIPGVTALVGRPSLFWACLVVAILTPLLAMRLIADEKRSGTMRLLRAAPVSTTALVAGKYLALLVMLLLVVAVAAVMPLTLAVGTSLDYGQLAAGTLGLALVAAAFAAICLFMSALTNQPALAALAGFGALVLLWVLNLAAAGHAGTALAWVAFEPHLAGFLRGEVDTADAAYFVIVAALFLGLTVWKLDSERLGG